MNNIHSFLSKKAKKTIKTHNFFTNNMLVQCIVRLKLSYRRNLSMSNFKSEIIVSNLALRKYLETLKYTKK